MYRQQTTYDFIVSEQKRIREQRAKKLALTQKRPPPPPSSGGSPYAAIPQGSIGISDVEEGGHSHVELVEQEEVHEHSGGVNDRTVIPVSSDPVSLAI